ncbi:MAG TPA: hypothetical protein VG963_00205 [Polyangiaceae bacterium]|nr:hypothetical protein [Polyangiaceae bacterium]
MSAPLAHGRPAETMPPIAEWWRVSTLTGSSYIVAREVAGAWWLTGANVPSPRSVQLPPGYWRIEPPAPWPPVAGAPLVLWAAFTLALDDPARLPGGGKLTSPVQHVERLTGPPELS